ncbi:mannonate dehydratase [Bacillus sp. SL00103]
MMYQLVTCGLRRKGLGRRHELVFEVVESLPVHEDIKLGRPKRDVYIKALSKTFDE